MGEERDDGVSGRRGEIAEAAFGDEKGGEEGVDVREEGGLAG